MFKKILFLSIIVITLATGAVVLANMHQAEARGMAADANSETITMCIEYKAGCPAEYSAPECCIKWGSYSAFY